MKNTKGDRMKKYAAAILTVLLLSILTGSSYTCAAKIVYRGQVATGRLMDVQYTTDGSNEAVTITTKDDVDYSVMELADPQRIVLDIYNLEAPGKQQVIVTGGEMIERIRYAQFDTYTARVVLEIKEETEYGVEKTEKGLVLFIGNKPADANQKAEGKEKAPAETASAETAPDNLSSYRNINYYNKGDRVYFSIKDAVLTEGDEFLKELYTGTYENSGKTYTVTFPTGKADLGNGIMKIEDQYLKSVEVITNAQEGTTSLIFNGTGKNTYLAYTRSGSGITSITVIKAALQNQRIVVIDPGHGGKATGAIYKDLYEKDLNLDIAKRLNALLKKKGVKTYMLRDDDSDIANYERAYIANKLNAKLYLSIHNNAMDDKNFRGTMTLYCPTNINSNFTGKTFANIIQKEILGTLKTVDRKVKRRPDLIVLKATNMPAALAEIAFMTNKADRGNLQNVAFRQKAAQALCNSVTKALAKVK